MPDPNDAPAPAPEDGAGHTDRLVRRAQEGDAEALDALFAEHYDDLRRFVRKRIGPALRRQIDDSEDILHSAMRGALKSLPEFEPQGEDAWLRWMGTIIVNKLASKVRHNRAQKRGDGRVGIGGTEGFGLIGATPNDTPTPSDAASRKEEQDRLYDALDTLPEERRDLLVKFHIRQLSLGELAEELDCSQEAVRQRILRAEQALESAVKKLNQ